MFCRNCCLHFQDRRISHVIKWRYRYKRKEERKQEYEQPVGAVAPKMAEPNM
jgi:hypothetical protein